jgi:hypothetical protein
MKEERKKKERRKNVYMYKKEEKEKNKAPRLSGCIRSFKRIQNQDPYSSFQPCSIR